jgi:hypothetical protein
MHSGRLVAYALSFNKLLLDNFPNNALILLFGGQNGFETWALL